jgi:hypothetical protein
MTKGAFTATAQITHVSNWSWSCKVLLMHLKGAGQHQGHQQNLQHPIAKEGINQLLL